LKGNILNIYNPTLCPPVPRVHLVKPYCRRPPFSLQTFRRHGPTTCKNPQSPPSHNDLLILLLWTLTRNFNIIIDGSGETCNSASPCQRTNSFSSPRPTIGTYPVCTFAIYHVTVSRSGRFGYVTGYGFLLFTPDYTMIYICMW